MKIKFSLFLLLLSYASLSAQTIRYTLEKPGAVSLVIYNEEGRLVRTVYSGQPQTAGAKSYDWDGNDDEGKPVPNSTSCTWKLLQLPAPLKADYLMNLLVTLPPGRDWWETGVGNHTSVRSIAVDGTGIYLGAGTSENVCNAMKMNLAGTERIWSAWQPDIFKGRWSMGVSAGKLYWLQQNGYVAYHSAAKPNGLYQYVGKGSGDNNYQTGYKWSAVWPGDEKNKVDWGMQEQKMDMAVYQGLMVISYLDHTAIQFRQPDDGRIMKQVKVENPAGVAIDNKGNALVISDSQVLRVTQNGTVTPVISKLTAPWRLDVDRKNGDIYVAERAPSHQVKRFNAAGTLIKTIGLRGGRQYGLYKPENLKDIVDITTTGNGFLVAESCAPRRVARFNQNGSFVKEWYTGTHWVPSVAPDPTNPGMVWGRADSYDFLRLQVDYKSKTWQIHSVYQWARLADKLVQPAFQGSSSEGLGGGITDFVIKTHQGQKYIVRRGRYEVLKIDEQNNKIIPVVAGRLRSPDQQSYLWTDANGDGEPQEPEYRRYNRFGQYGAYGFVTGTDPTDWDYYWYNKLTNAVYKLPLLRFSEDGVPYYKNLTLFEDKIKIKDFDNKGGYYEHSPGMMAKTDERIFLSLQQGPGKWGVCTFNQIRGYDLSGKQVFAVGHHVNYPNGPVGKAPFPEPGCLYSQKNCFAVNDICVLTDFEGGTFGSRPAITYAWDKWGLYVGGLFNHPVVTAAKPMHLYYHSNDNGSGAAYYEKQTGDMVYFAGRENEIGVYRISGWKDWVRQTGKVE